MNQISIIKITLLFLTTVIIQNIHGQKGYVWKKLGSGINAGVGCAAGDQIEVGKYINGELYVVVYNNIKYTMTVHKWNGSSWSQFPKAQAMSNSISVYDVAFFHGELYLSGNIAELQGLKRPGTNKYLGIIKYDGTKWDSLPNYPKFANKDSMQSANNLCVYKSKLYYTVGGLRAKLFSLDTFDNTSLIAINTRLTSYGFKGLEIVDNKLQVVGNIDSVLFKGKTSGMFFYDGTNFSFTKMKAARDVWMSKTRNDSQFVIITTSNKIELWQRDTFLRNITPSAATPYYNYYGITFFDRAIIISDTSLNYYDLDSSKWFKYTNRIVGSMAVQAEPNKALIVDCSNFDGAAELIQGAIVNGKMYFDKDSGCTFNSGDMPLTNTLVEFSSGSDKYYTMTDNSGNYSITVPPGTHAVSYYLPQVKSTIAPCSTISVTVSASTVTNNIDIAVHPSMNRNLSVKFNAYRGFRARRGFTEYYELTGTNLSFLKDSLIMKVKYPSNVTFVSSDITPYSNSSNELVFKFYNLNFNDTKSVKILFSTFVNTSKLGDLLRFHASVVNSAGDSLIDNNTDSLCQILVGSYDPNIKQSFPEGKVLPGLKKIKYVIHFQNTGTDTAYKVTVVDTITQKLGLRALKVTGTSHPSTYRLRVENKQTLVWEFDNIMLPDSHVNEKASHGYIAFETEINSALAKGDSITNKAFIYFDYNDAIITNTASVVMTEKTAGNTIRNLQKPEAEKLILYPNPAQTQVHITTDSRYNNHRILLYNSMGQFISTETISNGSAVLNVQLLPKGIYFVKLEGTEMAGKLLVE